MHPLHLKGYLQYPFEVPAPEMGWCGLPLCSQLISLVVLVKSVDLSFMACISKSLSTSDVSELSKSHGGFRFVMTGYPQSSILDGDFPCNKPSSYWGTPPFMWKPLDGHYLQFGSAWLISTQTFGTKTLVLLRPATGYGRWRHRWGHRSD